MKKAVIIGFGSMAKIYADKLLKGLIPNLSLFGFVCRNSEKYPEVSALGVKVFTSFDEALKERAAFDAVIVATPHKTHVEYALKAIRAGLYVLIEKPIASDLVSAELLLHLSKEEQNKCAMVFNWRTRDEIQRVKSILDGNELGKINHIIWTANFSYRTAYYHVSSAWRSTWEGEGGGLCINQDQHLFDAWNYFFSLPDEVYAQVEYGKWNGIKVDDSFEALFSYKDGKRGVLISSTIESPGTNRLEIHGEKGKLILEETHLELYLNEVSSIDFSKTAKVTTGIPFTKTEEDYPTEKDEEYVRVLKRFSLKVNGQGDCCPTIEDGEKALRLASAIYLSAFKGEKISTDFLAKEYLPFIEEKLSK